ncbi:Magnesium transporter [Vigna angularis]|uniref:Magnesium transporter n=1 Tax=Phaseolus angularis TaxID=3914 RepID=A0A8T0L348_PHAAN|nr:Magnesium transporter [Vigna angularis]
MTRLTAKVRKVRNELEQLMHDDDMVDDDDDMANLYLSRKGGSSSPVSGSSAANWFAASPTIGSKIYRANRASPATVRLDENDVKELEMLLENDGLIPARSSSGPSGKDLPFFGLVFAREGISKSGGTFLAQNSKTSNTTPKLEGHLEEHPSLQTNLTTLLPLTFIHHVHKQTKGTQQGEETERPFETICDVRGTTSVHNKGEECKGDSRDLIFYVSATKTTKKKPILVVSLRPTRNPYDTSKIAGGSSSGSASLVSAGLCPVALGVDGGGSVRMPASLCGVVAMKSEYAAPKLCSSFRIITIGRY